MESDSLHKERELLVLVARGDERAFKELLAVYQPLLLTYVFRLTRSVTVSEEIVQDVFLKIWMSREALAYVERFRSYLFIICRNYALDQIRKMQRELYRARDWEMNAGDREMIAGGAGPYPVPFEEEPSSPYTLIDEAVDQLPPQQQKVYLLSRRERLSYPEIAARIGLSSLTVKKYGKLAIAFITGYIRERMDKNF